MRLETLELACRMMLQAKVSGVPLVGLSDTIVNSFLEDSRYKPRKRNSGGNDMPYKIGIINATKNSMEPINEVLENKQDIVTYIHFTDAELLADIRKAGEIKKTFIRRIIHLVEEAEKQKVDGVALSCSSFTPYIDLLRSLFDFPLVSVDFDMLEKSVEIGNKIGLISTLPTAGKISQSIIESISEKKKKKIEINSEILNVAGKAILEGREDEHNRLIKEKVIELSNTCDVIVFAQLSMCRVLKELDVSTLRVPILTSAEYCISSLLDRLDGKVS